MNDLNTYLDTSETGMLQLESLLMALVGILEAFQRTLDIIESQL